MTSIGQAPEQALNHVAPACGQTGRTPCGFLSVPSSKLFFSQLLIFNY